jgi:hypothetical protein
VCVLEGIAIRQRQLSPDQYEIVDVRTSRGVLRSALLIPKAVWKALCEGLIKRERKQVRTMRTAK